MKTARERLREFATQRLAEMDWGNEVDVILAKTFTAQGYDWAFFDQGLKMTLAYFKQSTRN